MAQTVALDYYAVAVDRMMELFMKMNESIEETGNFDSLKVRRSLSGTLITSLTFCNDHSGEGTS
jgi:hypothetical protein